LLIADQQLNANFYAKHPQFDRRSVIKFLNMVYEGYVHGASETTMDLFDQLMGLFAMLGHPDIAKREEFVDAVYHQKLPEVVVAIELTAAVIGTAALFSAAREARRKMHLSEPRILDRKNCFE
jgi:hypothetical protein